MGDKMETENKKGELLKRAASLGIISVFSYLASYYTRNLLSVATPNMLATGEYTSEFVGLLSSVYFLVYAIGQLVNGFVGDMINPKYMISIGLAVTGGVVILFPLAPFAWIQVACFAVMGIGLSMLRGPIMKMVSENLSKDLSRGICACLSAASFAGPLIASVFAILFEWNVMFIIAGSITIAIALIAFISLSILEMKGMFVFHRSCSVGFSSYAQLFKIENFAFYMVIGGVVEIAASAITFWIPTYLSDALDFDSVTTNTLYSAIAMIQVVIPFLTIAIYKLVKERELVIMRCGFLAAVVSFICMMLVPGAWAKVIFLVIARATIAICSSVLWSIYIPGLGKTGRVSSINGVINCTGYLSASLANAIFASLLGLSWNGVIVIWCGVAAVGLTASLVVRNKGQNVTAE
jgi:sugar phosphate permease